jgi:hypothetical protein
MALTLKTSYSAWIEDSTKSPAEILRLTETDTTTGITGTELKRETIVIPTATTTELDFGGVASAKYVFVKTDKECTYSLDTSTPGADENPLPAGAYTEIKSSVATGLINISLTTTTTATTVEYIIFG